VDRGKLSGLLDQQLASDVDKLGPLLKTEMEVGEGEVFSLMQTLQGGGGIPSAAKDSGLFLQLMG